MLSQFVYLYNYLSPGKIICKSKIWTRPSIKFANQDWNWYILEHKIIAWALLTSLYRWPARPVLTSQHPKARSGRRYSNTQCRTTPIRLLGHVLDSLCRIITAPWTWVVYRTYAWDTCCGPLRQDPQLGEKTVSWIHKTRTSTIYYRIVQRKSVHQTAIGLIEQVNANTITS